MTYANFITLLSNLSLVVPASFTFMSIRILVCLKAIMAGFAESCMLCLVTSERYWGGVHLPTALNITHKLLACEKCHYNVDTHSYHKVTYSLGKGARKLYYGKLRQQCLR